LIGFGNGVRDCSTGSSHRRLGKTYSSCLAPWRAGPAEQAATGAEPPLRGRADVGAQADARGRRADDRASAAGGGGLHASEQLRAGKRYALGSRWAPGARAGLQPGRAKWAAARGWELRLGRRGAGPSGVGALGRDARGPTRERAGAGLARGGKASGWAAR
jgi:hypothetical protein